MWTRNLPLPAAPCGNRAILVAGRPLRKPVKPSTTGSTLARAFARAPGVLGSGGRFEGIGFSPSRFAARAQRPMRFTASASTSAVGLDAPVMNTREELQQAFIDFQSGRF